MRKTFFKDEEDDFVNLVEKSDKSTQTYLDTNLLYTDIDKLNSNINKLNSENNQLTHDYKELLEILSIALKLENNKEIDIEKIKTHFQIIINREIRRKFALPFIKVHNTIFNNYTK